MMIGNSELYSVTVRKNGENLSEGTGILGQEDLEQLYSCIPLHFSGNESFIQRVRAGLLNIFEKHIPVAASQTFFSVFSSSFQLPASNWKMFHVFPLCYLLVLLAVVKFRAPSS